MPYSSLPIPNTPATRIVDQDTYIYLAPPNHWAGKTGSTSTWTGATYGDDSTGDGTLAKPYATLKKAWQKAQEYIIQGNATLYIQFQKGIYGYTFDPNDRTSNPFPDNLYHPQGQRIVIQGDPAALKQRYLYRVKNYTWDLSRGAYYGHTGTVNIWRSWHYNDTAAHNPSGGQGTTAHGFTGEDVFGYVSITNAAQGVASNRSYVDAYNGVNTNSKYSYQIYDQTGHNWFRSQLNHGLSYEEANAICGLARIEGATSDAYDLLLQFKNYNLDGRVCTYPMSNTIMGGSLGGGLANGLSFAGGGGILTIPSNYPEPQYGQPNGFYGPTYGVSVTSATIEPSWGNYGAVAHGTGPSVNLVYPARAGGDVHITDDPHVLTNFPVVVKVYSASSTVLPHQQKPIPLYMDGCVVGSVRNIMFVNGDMEARSRTVSPRGTTLAPCSTLDYDYEVADSLTTAFYGRSPQCLLMKNGSSLSVRHVGMIGWGLGSNYGIVTSVSVVNRSTLAIDDCIDSSQVYTSTIGNSPAGSVTVQAELGRLHNTPALMVFGGGVEVADNGTLELVRRGDYAYANAPKSIQFAQNSSWIHALQRFGIVLQHEGNAVLGSTSVYTYGSLPGKFRMSINLPVIPGGTVFGGVSAGFLHPLVFQDSGGRGVTYTSIVGYTRTTTSLVPFARFFAVETAGPTFPHGNAGGGKTGWGNTSVAWSASNASGAVVLPAGFSAAVQNQPVTLYGVKLYDHAIDSAHALRSFISNGATLEFYAYGDQAEGATVANQFFSVGRNGAIFRTPSGVTISASEISPAAGTYWGYTYAFGNLSGAGVNYGGAVSTPVSLYDYSAYDYGCLINSGSRISLLGNLTVGGKSYVPLYLTSKSSFRADTSNISLQGGSHSQLLVQGSSVAELWYSGLISKNPQCFYITADGGNLRNYNYGIYVRQGGQLLSWGPIVSVGVPYARFAVLNGATVNNNVGLQTGAGDTPVLAGSAYNPTATPYSAPLAVDGGKVTLPSGYFATILSWDGGCDPEAAPIPGVASGRVGGVEGVGQLWGNPSLWHIWNTTQAANGGPWLSGSGVIKLMTRGAYGTNGNSAANGGEQLLYNAPRGASAWFNGVGGAAQGTTGWVGPRSGGLPLTPASGTVRNLAFMDRVYWNTPAAGVNSYGAAVNGSVTIQRNVGLTADPPGYCGAAFFVATDTMVNTSNYGH